MQTTIDRLIIPLAVLTAFMGVMLALFHSGRKLGKRFRSNSGATEGVAVIDAAVFALMGLLIGFEYSGAAERFDERRKLIIEEANAISTAYLRVDTVPASAQPKIRDDFRRYMDSRIETYQHIDDVPTAKRDLADSQVLQGVLWKDSVEAVAQSPNMAAAILFLPALNSMIDIATMRTAVFTFHPPGLIIGMLFLVAFVCAALAGFEMGGSSVISRLHVMGFVAILAMTLYIVIDMEYPRRGLIRVDATDTFLFQVREQMK